jgi:hypothetical protein
MNEREGGGVLVALMVERRGIYRALVWKPEGRRPLGRPKCRWEGVHENEIPL